MQKYSRISTDTILQSAVIQLRGGRGQDKTECKNLKIGFFVTDSTAEILDFLHIVKQK